MNPKRIFQFIVFGPLLVALVIAVEVVVGSGMDWMLGLPRLSGVFFDSVFASLLMICGLSVVATAGWRLFRGGRGVPYGDVVKSLQTTNLVKTGPYGFSRNPMILGYALILSSVGLYMGSIAGTLLVPVLALLMLSVWIRFVEERGLKERFGEEYRSYQESVPFLIPLHRRRKRV
jgi:protein-S-isoprenylcysteine O-methyltransferase Ste14